MGIHENRILRNHQSVALWDAQGRPGADQCCIMGVQHHVTVTVHTYNVYVVDTALTRTSEPSNAKEI